MPKPYDVYKQHHQLGQEAKGEVTRVTKTHVYLNVGDGAEGVIWDKWGTVTGG